ncbi:hypothetical protein D1136_02300 [Odoribacter sp. Z80]|nr:hypothetical protein [Odoribacter sp. Z80]
MLNHEVIRKKERGGYLFYLFFLKIIYFFSNFLLNPFNQLIIKFFLKETFYVVSEIIFYSGCIRNILCGFIFYDYCVRRLSSFLIMR